MRHSSLYALAFAALFGASAANAEIRIGVSLGTTGPGSSLGIPYKNSFQLIPKTLGGQFHTMQELEAERAALLAEVAASGLPAERQALVLAEPSAPRGLLHALFLAVRFDLAGFGHRRRLRAALHDAGLDAASRERVLALDARYRRLGQQRALLFPFGRLFRYWHTFHLPLAIVMALILVVHIAVAIAFGYGWT